MAQKYDIGTKAWQPNQEEGWIASEVIRKVVNEDSVRIVFRLENGQVQITNTKLELALE